MINVNIGIKWSTGLINATTFSDNITTVTQLTLSEIPAHDWIIYFVTMECIEKNLNFGPQSNHHCKQFQVKNYDHNGQTKYTEYWATYVYHKFSFMATNLWKTFISCLSDTMKNVFRFPTSQANNFLKMNCIKHGWHYSQQKRLLQLRTVFQQSNCKHNLTLFVISWLLAQTLHKLTAKRYLLNKLIWITFKPQVWGDYGLIHNNKTIINTRLNEMKAQLEKKK